MTRAVVRYEHGCSGSLVDIDGKRLGLVPGGGRKRFDPGWRETGAGRKRRGRRGFDYRQVAVDDHGRYACVEVLPDDKAPAVAAFLERMTLGFAAVGVRVQRVLTDNAMSYSSRALDHCYNHARPHTALAMRPPVSRL